MEENVKLRFLFSNHSSNKPLILLLKKTISVSQQFFFINVLDSRN